MLNGKPFNIQLTLNKSLNTKALLYDLMLGKKKKHSREMGIKQVDTKRV